jgi:serine/threonine protein kinase
MGVHPRSPNVLFDRNFAAKLSDIAFPGPHRNTSRLGTLAWTAPECLRGQPPSPAADIYSLGIITYECLVRRPPYERDTAREQLAAIDSAGGDGGGPPPPAGCSFEMALLLRECLHVDPQRRPAAAELDRRLAGWDPAAVAGGGVLPGPDGRGLGCENSFTALRRRWRSSASSPSTRSMAPSQPEAPSPARFPGPRRPPFPAFGESFSDRLMRDIFPERVAEALMRGERVPPEPKEMVRGGADRGADPKILFLNYYRSFLSIFF